MSTTDVPLSVLTTDEYFSEITGAVAAAKKGDRVALMSMSFKPQEPYVADLMRQLIAAAQRGVQACLVIDAHSFMVRNGLPTGPFFYGRSVHNWPSRFYRTKANFLAEFAAAGGTYSIINRPAQRFFNPIAGRSHIKMTVINGRAYVGGCNLEGTHQIDCMVRITKGDAVQKIYDTITGIAASGRHSAVLGRTDQSFALDAHTHLLLDSGVANQSLILEQAFTLIDEAQEWLLLTCQFFPNDETAHHLAAALRRGVRVRLVYNHPRNHENVYKLLHTAVLAREKTKHSKALFAAQLARGHRRLHAKVIATERAGMVGSHNYVLAGVALGTAEAAIVRHTAAFGQQAAAAIARQIPHLRLG